ncbi:Hint domain-containing protein [Shimia sp. R9_1]|uniref:Hint domain-containing protein n=1 Tax=Shimia sp. R9_1 TaxID=2821111 RepID=UPI001AD97A22|nr:Hint domain-containing protein [Shimia sp. R9_1]MBO9407386.1 Hint domain-containing protein [Shimia sp. R9_1]
MSWIGLLDKSRALFCANGLAHLGVGAGADTGVDETPMTRGSVVLEMRASPYDRPQTLLAFRPVDGHGVRFSLQAVPGGGVVLVMNRAGRTCHGAVNLDTIGRADALRVTYSWDLTAGLGRLSVEQPGTFRVAHRSIKAPIALSPEDVKACTVLAETRTLANDVCFIAFSNRIEPIGPMPSLSPETPVMTDRGYQPVGSLQRGDVVQASTGDLVPVLSNIMRTVPAAGNFAPIRLRAPFFGLAQDIVTSPTQRLVIGGSRVEYMFGSEYVLVPAGHLLHGNAATSGGSTPLTTYCQLLLPDHAAVLVAGTYLESFDIGRLRRKREILKASMLSGYPRAKLPEHSRTAYPVLREFDALTLAAQRAA